MRRQQIDEKTLIESAKRAMMGLKTDLKRMRQLKKKNHPLYSKIMKRAKKECAKAEKEYIRKLDKAELEFYHTEPFGYNPRGEYPIYTATLLREFADILALLNCPPKSKVLEVGCGNGWVAIFLSKGGYVVTEVDVEEDKIAIAKRKAREYRAKVQFVVKDAEKLEYEEKYDAVVFHASLHHILNERRVLQKCSNALKWGGKLVIYEPGEKHAQTRQSLEALHRYGTLEKGYSRKYLKKLLKEVGFKNVTCYTTITSTFDEKPLWLAQQIARILHSKVRLGGYPNVMLAKKLKTEKWGPKRV